MFNTYNARNKKLDESHLKNLAYEFIKREGNQDPFLTSTSELISKNLVIMVENLDRFVDAGLGVDDAAVQVITDLATEIQSWQINGEFSEEYCRRVFSYSCELIVQAQDYHPKIKTLCKGYECMIENARKKMR